MGSKEIRKERSEICLRNSRGDRTNLTSSTSIQISSFPNVLVTRRRVPRSNIIFISSSNAYALHSAYQFGQSKYGLFGSLTTSTFTVIPCIVVILTSFLSFSRQLGILKNSQS